MHRLRDGRPPGCDHLPKDIFAEPFLAKPVERERAIELRRHGLSYREIRAQVPVAKSTLSLWLRQVGLAKAQRQRLTERRLAAAHRGSQKRHIECLARVAAIHNSAIQE